jgi:transcriptional regulator with PAS, ATPase and Fis domain
MESDDRQTTREQLTAELHELRAAVAQLRSAEAQRAEAEEELRRKEAFNFALFNYNPELTVVVDKEGRVVRSNRAKRLSSDRLPAIGDVMYKDYAAAHSTDMHAVLMECMRTGEVRSFPELDYKDKVLAVTIAPFPQGAIIVSQDITAAKTAERDRLRLIAELRRALDEVESLQGLLPICSHCKRIRDDKGAWHSVERYISTHTQADFSHTICPVCAEAFYPEIWQHREEMKETARGG